MLINPRITTNLEMRSLVIIPCSRQLYGKELNRCRKVVSAKAAIENDVTPGFSEKHEQAGVIRRPVEVKHLAGGESG